MPRLTPRMRAALPDSAFAYIDSQGRRRLPINDAGHVRAALARFDRVIFEDEEARDRARERLLRAAKKHGIVPVGFITGQLRSERDSASVSAGGDSLPSGRVTFLLTDIEGSTAHLARLRDGYGDLLRDVRRLIRTSVRRADGHQVDARADEFFAVFKDPARAVEAACSIQRALAERRWPGRRPVRVRMGIHTGRPTLSDGAYIGLAVHTAARVCTVAHGGQIVLTEQTVRALKGSMPKGMRTRSLGKHRLPGLDRATALHQLVVKGLPTDFPPLRHQPA